MKHVAFLIIATNKYIDFVEPLVDSINKFVKIENAVIDCFVFTNIPTYNPKYISLRIDATPWPLITLLRYHHILNYWDQFEGYDHLIYIDSDMRVVAPIGEELIQDGITLCIHPGQGLIPSRHATFCREPRSEAYISYEQDVPYCIGALQMGNKAAFKELCSIARDKINTDLRSNYIPIFHDESVMLSTVYNHMVKTHPINYLNPGYCFPQGWNIPFEPKIMALDKNQTEIRS